jgi:hypothetical protein
MSEFTKTLIVDADSQIPGIYQNIASAITALASTGGRIIVERADDPYTITSSLTPVSNMEIIGSGAVKIIMTASDPAFQIISKDRVTISGFEIEMSNDSFESAINLVASTNCRFENLTMKATNSGASEHNGFDLVSSPINEPSNYNIIQNCHISGFETGVRIYKSNNNIIDCCIFDEYNVQHANTKYGISIISDTEETSHNIITNCILNGIQGSNSPECGIYVYKSDYNIVLGNITTGGNNIGIHAKSSIGTVIGGNVCDSNDGDGIRLAGESESILTKYTAIVGNVLSDNGNQTGENDITVKNYSKYNSIAGNVCNDGHDKEIVTEPGSLHTLIDGNVCSTSNAHGDIDSHTMCDNIITCNIANVTTLIP